MQYFLTPVYPSIMFTHTAQSATACEEMQVIMWLLENPGRRARQRACFLTGCAGSVGRAESDKGKSGQTKGRSKQRQHAVSVRWYESFCRRAQVAQGTKKPVQRLIVSNMCAAPNACALLLFALQVVCENCTPSSFAFFLKILCASCTDRLERPVFEPSFRCFAILNGCKHPYCMLCQIRVALWLSCCAYGGRS